MIYTHRHTYVELVRDTMMGRRGESDLLFELDLTFGVPKVKMGRMPTGKLQKLQDKRRQKQRDGQAGGRGGGRGRGRGKGKGRVAVTAAWRWLIVLRTMDSLGGPP